MDISARLIDMGVNITGNKLTQGRVEHGQHKNDDNKLILSGNQLGELVPPTALNARLQRVASIVDHMATKRVSFQSLTAEQQRDLKDVFQLANGSLDIKKLILTTVDSVHYQKWRSDVDHRLQLDLVADPFAALSGQTALQYSQSWYETQLAGSTALIELNS